MRNSIFIITIVFTLNVFIIESKRPSSDVNIETLTKNLGYPFEMYKTTTKDDYILELHRIPRGRNENENTTKKKQVALFMHGLISSSASWITPGPNRSLALTLADKGYDVWMGNNRGNTYSRKHKTKLETSFDYWDFSWHEFGIYDLPATIDYVLNKTGQEKILYVCFSEGCTQLVIMGSLKPEYNKKIEFALLFAPAVYLNYAKGLIPLSAPLVYVSMFAAEKWGYFPILTANAVLRIITKTFCDKGLISRELCLFFIFTIVGFGYDEIDRENLSNILAYEPAGCSWKQIIHYGFSYWNKDFRMYDYGKKKNLKIYNSTIPPAYPLENVNIPMAMYHGTNDYLASPKDVALLETKLPNVIERRLVKERKLNHYDFIFGVHIKELAYNRALEVYDKYIKSIN